MFIYTITLFLYIFAYCSLQTAIHQECSKPLFDLLTTTHQQFENILHPKILRFKQMFVDFFNKSQRLIATIRQVSEPKFLLLVQYESIELLHDIERGLSSIIELHEELIQSIEKKSSSILKDEPSILPTIVLARPSVDNFKLLRTLEYRYDISIITRDYHLLGILIDKQPDVLIDSITSMLIFDLNTKLDINLVQHKFLLLVQYESIELLHDIERGLSSIIELRSYVYDKQANITRDEFNDLLMYNNMIIIRTRQISSTIITRPKRLTLIIEYECGEQIPQWYRFCQQQFISYLAYKTILPSFIPPNEELIQSIEKKSSPILKDEPSILPTIILARPLVDNFKLLRTLECRHDISIITRDYHLLGISIDKQPDILIDSITSMLIFDLNTKLDINLVQNKIQSMTLHSCRIHIAILTSGSTPDFILSTYITPITQLAKQIQEHETNIEIQIKSFSSLDEFANHVAQLVQQCSSLKYVLTPTPSWNEKMLLRRCSSLNSISAQLILQRLKNVDLSTVNLDVLVSQCPEIPMIYLKKNKGILSNRQMKELHDAFDLFDRDRSGTISLSELKQVLIALNFNPTDTLVRKVMKEMDIDGNGSVEFDEFVKIMKNVYERKFTEDEMRRAFKCFDIDNSGYITADELHEVLRRLNRDVSERRISEVLKSVDMDHDGKISYEEFVHIVQDT
ncbi:unnamed protein product [Rotaria sp. Silwood2]|nr:unnamed protein product [Rotaria sp. Silwood2]